MKKLIYVFVLFLFGACDEYRFDDYITDFDYTSVYFPHQNLTRTFVHGEFDHIQVAVQMGGRRTNTQNEWVMYKIYNEIEVEGLTKLPNTSYSLSNTTFDILPGDLGGELTLTVNQEFFDQIAAGEDYYIPFKLTDTSVDSILSEKDSMILTFKVEAAGFGNYYHNGVLRVDSLSGGRGIFSYHQEEPVTNDVNNWELTSLSYDTLVTNGIANQKSGTFFYGFNLFINEDNTVGIYPNSSSTFKVTSNGISTYNPDKREFYLNYKYDDGNGNACTVADTLIFRNRILDGVNQWW